MNLSSVTFLSELSRVCLLLNERTPRGLRAVPVLGLGCVYISLINRDGDEEHLLEMGQDGACYYHLRLPYNAAHRGWVDTVRDDELADLLDEYVEEL